MSVSTRQLEEAVFQSIVPQLEAEGFQVFVHPSRTMLPPFLSVFQPDAVAYKGERKIAIEVMARAPGERLKVRDVQKLFADHPDWELRLVYAPPKYREEVIPISSKDVIEDHLRRIEGSFDAMGSTAALLTAWAVFEAAARLLLPANFGRAQTPERLLEALAFEGYVTPGEADMLRQVSKVRNEVAHGRLDLMPAWEQVKDLIDITRAIILLKK